MDLRDCIKKTFVRRIFVVISIFITAYLLWFFPIEHAINIYFSEKNIENILNKQKNISAQISKITYTCNADFSISLDVKKIKIEHQNTQILNTNSS